jgi:hypothetical protein
MNNMEEKKTMKQIQYKPITSTKTQCKMLVGNFKSQKFNQRVQQKNSKS